MGSFSDCEDRTDVTLEDKPSAPPRGRGTAVGVTSGHMRGVASVRGRPRSAPPRTHDKKLHRAHSCGSLLTKSSNGKFSGPDLWNILSASDQSSPITFVTTKDLKSGSGAAELALTLGSVPPPISILHLQPGSSRCCNLC